MKKQVIAALLAGATTLASAAQFEISQEWITDRNTDAEGTAQVLTVSGSYMNIPLSLSSRTQRPEAGGLSSSLELTGARAFGPVSAFAGIGHDLGATQFQYGVVGLSSSVPVWGGVTLDSVLRHRVNWETVAPSQTLLGAGVGYSVTKTLGVGLGYSRSWGDIEENAISASMRIKF